MMSLCLTIWYSAPVDYVLGRDFARTTDSHLLSKIHSVFVWKLLDSASICIEFKRVARPGFFVGGQTVDLRETSKPKSCARERSAMYMHGGDRRGLAAMLRLSPAEQAKVASRFRCLRSQGYILSKWLDGL